ncbi:MAG: glycoside hydrolase family 127 protein [Treponema sp.]|nr:glycoside hydrolase family 127 protein [Treponema sp.]
MINLENKAEIRVNGGLFKERENVNRSYLMELDTDCLLQNFYLEAGICTPNSRVHNPETVKMHWGWESPSCQLRGHFLGHWLSAASLLIKHYNDPQLKQKLDFIIDELERCQKLNGGKWVGSIPEKFFYRLETYEYIWSPQYTMHKTCLGLLDSYRYAGNKKALKIMNNLADWYVSWVNYEKKNCPRAIYNGEQGGMLEIWATLYEITGLKKYMTLAEAYSGNVEFNLLQEEKDALSNIHTNASIPLAHGACKMYQVTGEKKWLKIAEQFWRWAVEERGYFCTGGSNSGEFWIPCKMEGQFLNERDQEFCTVYNMVRFARYMYELTGDVKYQDYIELNIYNGFFAQQNKNTGMPSYFLPLNAGGKKSWGSKTRDFFCCHGTMVQAHTLYCSLAYAGDEKENLYINQYIPSSYKENAFSLTQSVDMKFYDTQSTFSQADQGEMSRWQLKFVIQGDGTSKKLYFRIPSWCKKEPFFALDGKKLKVKNEKGYFVVENKWTSNEIKINFPVELTTVDLPGDDDKVAFMEGPVVLAGLIDGDYGIKLNSDLKNSFIKQQEHLYSAFSWKQSTYNTKGQDRNFQFIPLYDVVDEKYTVYFTKK